MPLDTVKHILHLRSKKNQQVMQNIARLREIGQYAQSAQDILDGLHPWGKNKELYFHNIIPRMLFVIGIIIGLFGIIIHPYFPYIFSLLVAFLCCFVAYLMYEQNDPIEEVIDYLEQRMMFLKYQLHFNKSPQHLSSTSNSLFILSKLKQNFPLFTQGNILNEFLSFASTTWHEQDKLYQVMLFHYHFVDELAIQALNDQKQTLREVEEDRWGAFIFEMPNLGIAASNVHHQLSAPYHTTWKSTDILINQKINFFGLNQHQLARTLSPSLTLKISDFFQDHVGDLIYHSEENILCYCGQQNLFRVTKPQQRIRDISTLRGHLRRLSLPEYERFKQRMLNLIT